MMRVVFVRVQRRDGTFEGIQALDRVGGAWLADRVSFEKPELPAFRRIPVGLVTLMVDASVELPERLRISAVRLVPGRVRIEWDGEI